MVIPYDFIDRLKSLNYILKSTLYVLLKLFTIDRVKALLKQITENGLERSFVKYLLNSV